MAAITESTPLPLWEIDVLEFVYRQGDRHDDTYTEGGRVTHARRLDRPYQGVPLPQKGDLVVLGTVNWRVVARTWQKKTLYIWVELHG